MSFFKKDAIDCVTALLSARNDTSTLSDMTALQNEIGVEFQCKVTAVVGVDDDALASSFAITFADSFSKNNESTFLIDGNLYNPCLCSLLGKDISAEASYKEMNNEVKFIRINDMLKIACLGKEIYPSSVYKKGIIENIINDNKNNANRFVVIMPSIKKHKELLILKNLIDSIVLVVQKDATINEHIFNAIQFFKENDLPLAKVVLIK